MLKKSIIMFSILAFLVQPISAFAFPWRGHGGHDGPGNFHREVIVHRVPPGYTSLLIGGLALLYCEGLFYRYTPAGYVVVTPPMGAVVPALPPGYTTIYENGMPYYYYGYTYYAPAPNGYTVVSPPAIPAVPQAPLPATTVAVAPTPAPVVSSVASATPSHPALYGPAQTGDKPNNDVYEIYIPNGNGSYTSVTLRKTAKGFIGPQGEFYEDHPTVEQLRERYTKA